MEHGSETQGKTPVIRVCYLLCQSHRFLAPRQRLVRIAKEPQQPHVVAAAQYAIVVPEERRAVVVLGIVERDTLGKMRMRIRYGSQVK
jgi:hypothetical protein